MMDAEALTETKNAELSMLSILQGMTVSAWPPGEILDPELPFRATGLFHWEIPEVNRSSGMQTHVVKKGTKIPPPPLKKTYLYTSGGPLSALTCCVNARLLSGDKKNIAVNLFSKLGWELDLYYASYDDFHPDILARMYT